MKPQTISPKLEQDAGKLLPSNVVTSCMLAGLKDTHHKPLLQPEQNLLQTATDKLFHSTERQKRSTLNPKP